MSLLGGIVAHVARRVAQMKRETSVEALRERPLYARVPSGLAPLLTAAAPRRVAEVRFATPEYGFRVPRGTATAEVAASLAAAALRRGAAAVAVLVERNFHGGDWEHLAAARAALPLACLIARDFVLDEYQLELARAHGADAVTLAGAVAGARAPALAEAARALGLGVVAEARNAAQLEVAREARPDVLLVAARDARTSLPDLSAARELAPLAGDLPLFVEITSDHELEEAARLGGVWLTADLLNASEPRR